jgi:hypothetical protein
VNEHQSRQPYLRDDSVGIRQYNENVVSIADVAAPNNRNGQMPLPTLNSGSSAHPDDPAISSHLKWASQVNHCCWWWR